MTQNMFALLCVSGFLMFVGLAIIAIAEIADATRESRKRSRRAARRAARTYSRLTGQTVLWS